MRCCVHVIQCISYLWSTRGWLVASWSDSGIRWCQGLLVRAAVAAVLFYRQYISVIDLHSECCCGGISSRRRPNGKSLYAAAHAWCVHHGRHPGARRPAATFAKSSIHSCRPTIVRHQALSVVWLNVILIVLLRLCTVTEDYRVSFILELVDHRRIYALSTSSTEQGPQTLIIFIDHQQQW